MRNLHRPSAAARLLQHSRPVLSRARVHWFHILCCWHFEYRRLLDMS